MLPWEGAEWCRPSPYAIPCISQIVELWCRERDRSLADFKLRRDSRNSDPDTGSIVSFPSLDGNMKHWHKLLSCRLDWNSCDSSRQDYSMCDVQEFGLSEWSSCDSSWANVEAVPSVDRTEWTGMRAAGKTESAEPSVDLSEWNSGLNRLLGGSNSNIHPTAATVKLEVMRGFRPEEAHAVPTAWWKQPRLP